MGHYMAEKIPNCEAMFIEGDGIFEHLAEILATLVNEPEHEQVLRDVETWLKIHLKIT